MVATNGKLTLGQEIDQDAEFVPTYELVLAYRNKKGEPNGRCARFESTEPAKVGNFFENHRRRNPLPKKQRLEEQCV